jgi:hypothetical protein
MTGKRSKDEETSQDFSNVLEDEPMSDGTKADQIKAAVEEYFPDDKSHATHNEPIADRIKAVLLKIAEIV